MENECRKNMHVMMERLDETQGVIEAKAYDILNNTDKMSTIINDAMNSLNNLTEDSCKEEMKQTLDLIKESIPKLLDCVYDANDASHDLEENASNQKEIIGNIQCAIDYFLSLGL